MEAFVVCQQFLEDQLVSPGTARYGGTANSTTTALGGQWTVRTYVDSQNAFGAVLRTDFVCVVEKAPSGNGWRLVRLETSP